MVRETLTWVEQILHAPASGRKRLRRAVLKALRQYSVHGEGKADRSAGNELADQLEKSGDYEFIGFAPNVQYIRESGDRQELSAHWVHPWGTPTLLYKHKALPIVIQVNPGIRLNESFVDEMNFNRHRETPMRGLSG